MNRTAKYNEVPDDFKKSTQMLCWLAQREGGKIDKLKALKLYWLADRLHLREYGRLISGDTYYAMEFGPVASNAKDIIDNSTFLSPIESQYRNEYIDFKNKNTFISKHQTDLNEFSDSDLIILDKIYNQFSIKNKFALVDLSHVYPEWTKFKSVLNSRNKTRCQMEILDFFENPSNDEFELFKNQSPETLNYNKNYYNEFRTFL